MKTLPSGKIPFNWNVGLELRKKFDEICEAKGYQKQAQVERMLKIWIDKEEGRFSETNQYLLPEIVKVSSIEFLTELEAIVKGWIKDRRKVKRDDHLKSQQQ